MSPSELSAAALLSALEFAARPETSSGLPPGPAPTDLIAPQVLDVRAPARAALGHIEAPDYLNVPGSRVLDLADAAVLGLDRERPVVVVCDRGNSSRPVAQLLQSQGFDARSLTGGMLAWMLAAVRREVPGVRGLDRLVQVDRVGKGALGYFAARGGEALVVDPARDLSPYLSLLEESGCRLVGVVDTHCHADYLSGGPALAAARGVPYFLHPGDAVDPYAGRAARIAFSPLAEGDALAVGDARLTVEHLPGHTEGSLALRLGSELALTGDFLFVESVGRPDLADRTAAWTALLWQSLQRVRREWNPELRILPAHYAAERERQPSRVVEARLGDLAARNPPLALGGEAEFTAWVDARDSRFPDEYRLIKQANLGLVDVPPELANELEAGKNQCAVTR
jgi:glyoxylase-like metal-dependent hydrolase (beta-lactamase superfamily II)